MEIEPFQTEWREDWDSGDDWRNRKGNVVVSFFGHEIYASEACDEPHENVLDRDTNLALAELGNLLGERMGARIKVSDYDELVVK